MKKTQHDRILAMLREARGEGVCSWDLAYRSYMPHASSRIPELNATGFVIRGETRDWGDGHGAHAHYTLISEPDREPHQQELIRAEA